MLLWQSLESGTQNAKSCQDAHRRTELVPLFRGGEVGDVAVGQNQEYVRLKMQNWGFTDLSLRQFKQC